MEDGTIIKECSQILKFEMVKDDTTKDEKITLKEKLKSIFTINMAISIIFLIISVFIILILR